MDKTKETRQIIIGVFLGIAIIFLVIYLLQNTEPSPLIKKINFGFLQTITIGFGILVDLIVLSLPIYLLFKFLCLFMKKRRNKHLDTTQSSKST